MPGAVIDDLQRLRFAHATADGKPARQVQRLVGSVLAQAGDAPLHELVDIAVIVGEQDPRLGVGPVRTGVVLQALQSMRTASKSDSGRGSPSCAA